MKTILAILLALTAACGHYEPEDDQPANLITVEFVMSVGIDDSYKDETLAKSLTEDHLALAREKATCEWTKLSETSWRRDYSKDTNPVNAFHAKPGYYWCVDAEAWKQVLAKTWDYEVNPKLPRHEFCGRLEDVMITVGDRETFNLVYAEPAKVWPDKCAPYQDFTGDRTWALALTPCVR